MKKILSFSLSFLTLSLFFNSYAGDTQVYGASARGQSMQAFTGVADDPSAIFYNPAGLTQISNKEIESDLLAVLPKPDYNNSNTNTRTTSSKLSLGPTLYASTPVGSSVVLGVGLYSPNARASTYSINSASYDLALKSQIIRLDFAPSIAFKLLPSLSLGADMIFSRVTGLVDALGLEENGSGLGVSARVGILWQPVQSLRLGASYTAPMNVHLQGHGSLVGAGYGDFYGNTYFPGILSLGVGYLIHPKLLFSFAVEDEMWSSMKRFQRSYPTNPIINAITDTPLHARDSYNIRGGIEYYLTQKDSLRAGYSYETPATPQSSLVPFRPDFYTHIASLGYSRKYGQWRFDAGYEFAYLNERQSYQPIFPGTYRMKVNSVLLGIVYTFK